MGFDRLNERLSSSISLSGRTQREPYVVMTLIAFLGIVASLWTKPWREAHRTINISWFVVAALLYLFFWAQTIRRLRDSGDPLVLHWCFLWGGAVIPVWLGCKNPSREDRWDKSDPRYNGLYS
ncbi:MAG TPA: DUF805 domain-containing protein [Sphingopyxis sp.]|uniref:DUF805 domain-containing protein n=1 Tax=Sphingopyxis sp. TaxID=1908224 RepID=UPI002E338A08|nr:DUF805 domain-containing protein [Sphingopyxis sp.]HEX2811421.1 DUF805 domain-containing protein [Sphingopyxis sp.]